MAPPDDNDNKPKNPWDRGAAGNSDRGTPNRGPWGGKNGGANNPPPDFDEALHRLQTNLRQMLPGGLGGERGIAGLIAIVIFLLWLASGLYIIVPGEHGVIQRFGAWNRTQAEEGLGYHLPWPVETMTKVNVSEIRRMEIGFTDGPQGPTARQDVPEESLMLTSDANIVSVDLVVLWNVKSANDYLFNILDPENTIKKVAESAIREVVGQTEMFPIITTDREQVAERTREIMEKTLDQYKSGVNISQVLIQEAEVHPDVQDAFQDVQSAKQDAFDAQNRAGAYREDILPRARGQAIKIHQDADAYKQAAIVRATGDASRFNAVYQAYQLGPDVTKKRMYIETMESILKTAQKTIIDGNGKNGGVVPYMSIDNDKAAPEPANTEAAPATADASAPAPAQKGQ